jgi:hypothetical protein
MRRNGNGGMKVLQASNPTQAKLGVVCRALTRVQSLFFPQTRVLHVIHPLHAITIRRRRRRSSAALPRTSVVGKDLDPNQLKPRFAGRCSGRVRQG